MRLLKHAALMCTLLLSALGMLAILSVLRLQAQNGGGPVASRNGDIDCDGRLTINDPVGLLNFMFLGGPAPCAIAQEQSPCCPDLVTKLDAILQAVEDLKSPCGDPEDRLVDNEDGTVTDTCAGIMWQRGTVSVDLDLDGVPEGQFNFNQAQLISGQSRVGNHSDWRLPTYKEVASLLRYLAEKPYRSDFIPEFDFNFRDASMYWTSSPANASRYVVQFDTRRIEQRGTDEKFRVWLVRNVQ